MQTAAAIIPRIACASRRSIYQKLHRPGCCCGGNVAVKFMLAPWVDGLRLEVRAVDVVAWFTTCAEGG
jgi:hypothetical protein